MHKAIITHPSLNQMIYYMQHNGAGSDLNLVEIVLTSQKANSLKLIKYKADNKNVIINDKSGDLSALMNSNSKFLYLLLGITRYFENKYANTYPLNIVMTKSEFKELKAFNPPNPSDFMDLKNCSFLENIIKDNKK